MQNIKNAIFLTIFFFVLTGIIYPLLMTGIAKIIYPIKANGSLISYHQKIIGSKWIGQSFTAPQYFWGRPSATTPTPYNALNSSGSNFGPSNSSYFAIVKSRANLLRSLDPSHTYWVPVELVTASASGLDPNISPAAAFYQIPRIAATRHISPLFLKFLVNELTQHNVFIIPGESVISVLQLNMALDVLTQQGLYHV